MSRSWKRSEGMSYKEWGRVQRERVLMDDWKQQVEEMEVEEETPGPVFVIIDEWEGGDTKYSGQEIVDAKFFPTLNEAWDALHLIAEAHSVEIDVDDYSFEPIDLPSAVEYESYYILELNHG